MERFLYLILISVVLAIFIQRSSETSVRKFVFDFSKADLILQICANVAQKADSDFFKISKIVYLGALIFLWQCLEQACLGFSLQ